MDKTERDAIIKRIVGLMAKTTVNGCSVEEALAASAKVAELLNKYQLDMSDLEISNAKCVQDDIKTGQKQAQPIDLVVVAISYFTDTRAWHTTDHHGFMVHKFFGLEHDVAIAKYIYKICDWALTWDWEDYKKTPAFKTAPPSYRSKLKASFQMGEVVVLNKRLRQMKDDQKKQNIETTGRDLVIVKGAVVTEEFAKLNLDLRGGRTTRGRSVDPGAYASGKDAGARVAINPGVNQAKPAGELK